MDKLRSGEIYALAGPSPNSLGDEIQGIKSAGIFYNLTNATYALPKGMNRGLAIIIDENLRSLKNNPRSIYYQLLDKYNLQSFRDKKWKVPQWIKILFITTTFLIIVSVIFIVVLKGQVNKKHEFLRKGKAYFVKPWKLVKLVPGYILLKTMSYFGQMKFITVLFIGAPQKLSLQKTTTVYLKISQLPVTITD